MNLVNELQISAEQDDVLTVLRKTKRLASKLDRHDIADWLKSEQGGYEYDRDVPDYRMVGGTVACNTNGFVPAGFGYSKNGVEDIPSLGTFPTPLRESISSILSMIENVKSGNNTGAYLTIDERMDETIRSYIRVDPRYARQVIFMMHLNHVQFLAIPEQIKDKVLEWACDLESAGITGEGLSFSAKEKEIAHAITFNIHNSKIEQLNNLGSNQRGAL